MTAPLLEVTDLVTAFHTDEGTVRAVDGVSFDVAEGGTLGIVGESGCGKSVTSLSIMQLLPSPPGLVERGTIRFEGKDLLELSEKEMQGLRGNRISMIFQEPMTSLNPVYTAGQQIMEAIRMHRKVSRKDARKQAIEMLSLVGIPAPEQRVDEYPHQLSGGMRQRVMIAMALACEPKLLIADEPTTALDVTIQAQILDLLNRLKTERTMSIILITHDLGVVAEFVDDVERAETKALFADPKHPYTRGLLRSVPSYGGPAIEKSKRRLPTIRGVVPDLRDLPTGCRFQERCDDVIDRCRTEEPRLEVSGGRSVACWVTTSEASA
ncbi:MAG: ABC transporter ATP-binding protein [Deltaproteobacteria bacterium]|nr:ABC transporter ATP-binding protein [Deltaproteobacteria bacterium]